MTRPHRAFFYAAGSDTAGTNVRAARAFARLPSDWEAHSMVSMDNYIAYPIDLPYSRQGAAAAYDLADVAVLNATLYGHHILDNGQGKPTILVHHGKHEDHFDQTIWQVIDEAQEIGARQIGTTVDLELLGPPGLIEWIPTCYDLRELAQLRLKLYERHSSPTGQWIRVLHAPTDRKVKSTEAVIEAVRSLTIRGVRVSLQLIEGETHAETLRRKASGGEIFVDQLNLGYGCNAIEAWAMGMPVVANFADPAAKEHAIRRYDLPSSPTGLPFIEATEQTLEETLFKLVFDAQERQFWANIGLDHVNRWHSEENYVKTMSKLFNEQIGVRTTPSRVRRGFPSGLSHEQRLEMLRKATREREANRVRSRS